MSRFKKTNKLSMDDILVVTDSSGMHDTDESLVDTATALNILDGELGVVSWDFEGTRTLGEFILSGGNTTPAQVNAIKVIQGTPQSATPQNADVWEVSDPAYVSSGVIRNDAVRSVTVKSPEPMRSSAYVLSGLGTAADESEYKLYIELDSVRKDRDYGSNDAVIHAQYLTPDYTALGTTAPTSHLLHNLAYRINTQSKLFGGSRDVIALGIDIGGEASGTALSTLTCGTSLNVVKIDEVDYGVTFNEAMIYGLYEAVADDANLTAASEVILIDPVNGAGDTNDIDCLVLLTLEENTGAYFDNIPFRMPDMSVRVASTFLDITARVETTVTASQGFGQGWKWVIDNDNRARLNKHTMQNRPFMEEYSPGYSYVDADAYYTSYIVEYFDWEETLTTREQSPKTLTILLPSTVSCADIDGTTPVAPAATITDTGSLVSDIETILTDWLEACDGVVVSNPDSTGLVA